MAGYQDLKELVGFGLSVGEGIAALADGGVSLSDVVKFVEAARRAPAAFSGLDQVMPQLKDLDDVEKEELKKFVEEDFDIPQDQVEVAVEAALKVAIDLSDLLKIFGAGVKPVPVEA